MNHNGKNILFFNGTCFLNIRDRVWELKSYVLAWFLIKSIVGL